jgi:uncharacterized phage infection (PIP) family protein YhgE
MRSRSEFLQEKAQDVSSDLALLQSYQTKLSKSVQQLNGTSMFDIIYAYSSTNNNCLRLASSVSDEVVGVLGQAQQLYKLVSQARQLLQSVAASTSAPSTEPVSEPAPISMSFLQKPFVLFPDVLLCIAANGRGNMGNSVVPLDHLRKLHNSTS